MHRTAAQRLSQPEAFRRRFRGSGSGQERHIGFEHGPDALVARRLLDRVVLIGYARRRDEARYGCLERAHRFGIASRAREPDRKPPSRQTGLDMLVAKAQLLPRQHSFGNGDAVLQPVRIV